MTITDYMDADLYYRKLIATLPSSLEQGFKSYRRKLVKKLKAHPAGEETPIWLKTPLLLHAHYKKAKRSCLTAKNLSDILWLQYCLYYFARIQDDIIDKESDKGEFLLMGNIFLMEAEKLLIETFKGHVEYQNLYRNAVLDFSSGMAELEIIQQKYDADYPQILEVHKQISQLNNLGAVLVSHFYGYAEHKADISELQNSIIIAGQIIDDIEDLQADLARGRYNYAAKFFLCLQGITDIEKVDPLAEISKAIMLEGGMSKIFDVVLSYLEQADQAARNLQLDPAIDLVNNYSRGITHLKKAYHQKRVEKLVKLKAVK